MPDVVRCNGAMGHNVGPGEPRFDMEFVENLAFRELFKPRTAKEFAMFADVHVY